MKQLVLSLSIRPPVIEGGWVLVQTRAGGGTGQKTEHCQENVFRTRRQSLLRDQIFSLISKGFYLSPSGEIIGVMPPKAVFLEIFRADIARIGISSSWGSCFISILNARGPLGSNLKKRLKNLKQIKLY